MVWLKSGSKKDTAWQGLLKIKLSAETESETLLMYYLGNLFMLNFIVCKSPRD